MYLTQSQYAKRCEVSQQAISRAVRAGKIPVVDGKIDPDIADAVWRWNRGGLAAVASPMSLNPASVSASPVAAIPPSLAAPQATPEEAQAKLTFVAPPPGSAASEQAALARSRREKIEMEMAEKRRELQPLREFEEAWAAAVLGTRNRLLLIPDQITDPAARAQVDRLLREALIDLSRLGPSEMKVQVREEASAA